MPQMTPSPLRGAYAGRPELHQARERSDSLSVQALRPFAVFTERGLLACLVKEEAVLRTQNLAAREYALPPRELFGGSLLVL